MMDITNLDQLKQITSQTPIVICDFCASWCGPCKALKARLAATTIPKFANDPMVAFVSVDIDKNREIAVNYSAMSVPTIMFFVKGVLDAKGYPAPLLFKSQDSKGKITEHDRIVGNRPELPRELEAFIPALKAKLAETPTQKVD